MGDQRFDHRLAVGQPVMADNKDCPKCEGTGTVGPDLGHQVPCDATGNDNDGMDWYCADGTVTLFGCPKCGTTDTGRFDGAMVCIDCLDQYDAERERASLAEEADDRASWEDVGCHICGQSMTYFEEGNRVCAEAPGSFCRRG